jgi:hypothetical protein
MNKDALIREYENHGLIITDFHLGLRLAKPAFFNTIIAGIVLMTYLALLTIFYKIIFIETDSDKQVGLVVVAFIVVLFSRYFSKIIAIFYISICIFLVLNLLLDIEHSDKLDLILQDGIVLGTFLGLFVLAIVSTIIIYRTNRNIVIKDGIVSIPASDVEQSLFAFVLLKPLWGLFYKRNIHLEDIISVKNDGYGNKDKDIYPVTIIDKKASNRLVFTSRQKRDEFRTKITILLGQQVGDESSFGDSE